MLAREERDQFLLSLATRGATCETGVSGRRLRSLRPPPPIGLTLREPRGSAVRRRCSIIQQHQAATPSDRWKRPYAPPGSFDAQPKRSSHVTEQRSLESLARLPFLFSSSLLRFLFSPQATSHSRARRSEESRELSPFLLGQGQEEAQ